MSGLRQGGCSSEPKELCPRVRAQPTRSLRASAPSLLAEHRYSQWPGEVSPQPPHPRPPRHDSHMATWEMSRCLLPLKNYTLDKESD